MAFEKVKLTNEIERLEEQTRESYDDIFNWGNPGYVMRKYQSDDGRYIAAKRKYDVLYPKYVALKAKNDAAIAKLKSQVDKLEEKDSTAKNKKETGGVLDKAKKEYERALDFQDPERIKTAKENLRSARANYQQAGKTAVPKTEEVEAVVGEQEGGFYEPYTLQNNEVIGPGGNQGVFVDVKTAKGIEPKFFTSLSQARQAFLKEYYSGPGKIIELQNQLLASNYIKPSEIQDGTWYTGIDELLVASTLKRVSDAKYGGEPETSIQDFLELKRSGSGGGQTRVNRDISTRGDARTMLNMYMSDLVGANASEEEHEAFYKELNRSEMRETSYTKDGSTVGSVMTDAERLLIAAKVARKKLRNTEADAILNSARGSRAAVDIAELQSAAADFGIKMSAGEALRYIADGVGQANYLEKQKERLRLIAIKMNPNLADHINAGGNVRELADVYGNIKSRKLGVVVKDSVFDKDVLEAVNKGKSAAQFETELQGNPEWRFTKEAREVGADFVSTISRMWGRG